MNTGLLEETRDSDWGPGPQLRQAGLGAASPPPAWPCQALYHMCLSPQPPCWELVMQTNEGVLIQLGLGIWPCILSSKGMGFKGSILRATLL